MPSGVGRSDLHQLKDKDDIEDDPVADPVNLAQNRVRTRPPHPSDPSNAPFIQEELQHLPVDYLSHATVQSKTATKILIPIGASIGRTRPKPQDYGPQPGSNLHRTRNQGIVPPRKRELVKSAISEDTRPRKQQKRMSAMEQASVDTDDEDGDDTAVMEVDDPYSRGDISLQHGERQQRKMSTRGATSQGIISSKRAQNSIDLSKPDQTKLGQQKIGQNEVESVTRSTGKGRPSQADVNFSKVVDDIAIHPKAHMQSTRIGGSQKNSPGRWNSGDGDSDTTWTRKKTTPQNQRQKQSNVMKFNLLCFQWGIRSYPENDVDGMFIQLAYPERLAIFSGEKGKEVKVWDVDPGDISNVSVNTASRKFAIKMGTRNSEEFDRHVLFTLKDGENIDICKTTFFQKNLQKKPAEREMKYFDKLTNGLNVWEERFDSKKQQQSELESVTIYQQDTQEKKKSQEITVEIPLRRSARNKVDRGSRADIIPSKRSRGSSTDGFENPPGEIRSPKIPKLELPKPRWRTSLVYPAIGPKREVVDYDDLSRLNSDQFLNDNIVNFYLRYIEVQLRKKNPELAEETHFLNTFFYERLTKKDEKGKREIDSVLKWTAKVDIFKTSYIVVPINESSHWYLAIICNLCNLERKMKDKIFNSPEKSSELESSGTLAETQVDDQDIPLRNASDDDKRLASTQCDGGEQDDEIIETRESLEHMALDEWQKAENTDPHDDKVAELNRTEIIELDDSPSQKFKSKGKDKPKAKEKIEKKKNGWAPDTPAIIILDSMGHGGGSSHPHTIRNLRDYLAAEALNKRNLEITKDDIKAVYAKAPNQNNWYDCGLFLLHYVERFLKKPKEFVAMILTKQNRIQDQELWRKEEIGKMRGKLFRLFIQLHEDQEVGDRGPKRWGTSKGSEDKGQKVGDGEKYADDVMAMDAKNTTKDEDMQKAFTAPGNTALNKGIDFTDDLVASGGNSQGGKDAPTNPAIQVIIQPTIESINLEEGSNSPEK